MSRILVAYFSASGRTREVAQRLAQCIEGDLHEIIPKDMYTDEDLNWMNRNSRTSVEMRDDNARPEIANLVEDMSMYDVVYVGFPIWWYVAPRIINTFLESYDMSGKLIVPFATSSSSEMGATNAKLAPSCSKARLMEGKVFRLNTNADMLREWAMEVIDKGIYRT